MNAETILIRNATVMTVTKGTMQNGSVLIENGKISAIGKNISAPADATVVDASGKFLIPGIIDCHSHTAVEGGVNEGTVSDSSMVDIRDVLNPSDINIYRALAGGLTVSNVLHGSANAIGGQTVVIKLRWGKTAQEMIFEGATPGIKFALGENPKRQGYPAQGFGTTGPAPERRYPGHAHGCGRSNSPELYWRRKPIRPNGKRTTKKWLKANIRFRRAKIYGLNRWWKCWKVSAMCTRTATAPTKF